MTVAELDSSQSAFCRVLAEGMSTMSQNVASAGQDGLDQFVLLTAQVAETSRLMARLAEAAPKEIALDMRRAAKAWDDQMAAIGKGAGDPFGALGAIFVSGLSSAASLRIVDDWSLTNCGQPVFGIANTAAGSGTQCGWFPTDKSLAGFGILKPETDANSLLLLLDLLSTNLLDAEDTAGALLREIQRLDPVPRTSLEALGRMQWSTIDPAASLDRIVGMFNSQCKVKQRWTRIAEANPFEGISAYRPAGRGLGTPEGRFRASPWQSNRGSFWGRCHGAWLVQPLTLIFACDEEQQFVALNLYSGAVTRTDAVSGVPTRDEAQDVLNAGDRIVWTSSVDIPQTGLDEPRTKRMLHSFKPDSAPTAVEVASYPTADDCESSFGRIWEAVGDRLVTHIRCDEPSIIKYWSTNGTLLGEFRDRYPGTRVTNHLLTLAGHGEQDDQPMLLLDLRSGESSDLPVFHLDHVIHFGFGERGPVCPDRSVVFERAAVYIQETATGVAVGSGPLPERKPFRFELLRSNRYSSFSYRPNARLELYDLNANLVREYGEDILDDVEVIYGWLVATNKAGTKLIIDPETGAEAVGLDSVLANFLLNDEKLVYAESNAAQDKMKVLTSDQLYEFTFSSICPN